MNQSVSHTSLNSKPFQPLKNKSPELTRVSHFNKIKHQRGYTNGSLKNPKELKYDKQSKLAKELQTDPNSSQNEKKMINMLKVYKNVLNKMQKNTDSMPNVSNKESLSDNKKVPVSKIFQQQHTATKSDNHQPTAFSASKINKKGSQNYKTSPLPLVVKPQRSKTVNPEALNNSLKNVNKKAKKLSKISPEEEIMCDLEVASYFDERKLHSSSDIYECDDMYYFDENSTSKFSAKKASNSYLHNTQSLEDDSKNLEVLVRQLAAEAALSTLNDSKINSHEIVPNTNNEFIKSFNSVFGNLNEPLNNTLNSNKSYLYKNKGFNNYETVPKSVKKKFYTEDEKK